MTRTNRSVPGRLDLQHGSVALVEVPKGTTIDLCLSGTTMATLRWESKATVVLGTTAAGLQAQIDGGEISIDDKPRRNTIVIMDQGKVTELALLESSDIATRAMSDFLLRQFYGGGLFMIQLGQTRQILAGLD